MKLIGKNAVMQALNSNMSLERILISETSKNSLVNVINLARKKRVKLSIVPKIVLDKETTDNHQGVIAFANDFKYSEVDDILNFAKAKGEDAFIVILDEISDPHNLGSIIRTCECAGVHGVIIPKNRACGVTDTVVKVSTGAISNVKIARVTNLNDTIRNLKKQNIFIYGLELGGNSIYNTNLKGNIAIVVGSEGFGISKLTKSLCDEIITLPMKGRVNSLNASCAAAISIYEALKQRIS